MAVLSNQIFCFCESVTASSQFVMPIKLLWLQRRDKHLHDVAQGWVAKKVHRKMYEVTLFFGPITSQIALRND